MAKATETTATENKSPEETKFPISVLRKNCVTLFKVTTSTFDGATYGKNGEYTVGEMKNLIDSWGKEEVKK